MGRKDTGKFSRQSQPLKNRVNIVISKNPDYKVKDAVVVHECRRSYWKKRRSMRERHYVIGGESIYRAMLKVLRYRHLVTKIDHAYVADTYFPSLDEDPEWKMTKVSDEQTCFDLEYVFYGLRDGFRK